MKKALLVFVLLVGCVSGDPTPDAGVVCPLRCNGVCTYNGPDAPISCAVPECSGGTYLCDAVQPCCNNGPYRGQLSCVSGDGVSGICRTNCERDSDCLYGYCLQWTDEPNPPDGATGYCVPLPDYR